MSWHLLVLLALVPSLAARGVTTYAIDPGASQGQD